MLVSPGLQRAQVSQSCQCWSRKKRCSVSHQEKPSEPIMQLDTLPSSASSRLWTIELSTNFREVAQCLGWESPYWGFSLC